METHRKRDYRPNWEASFHPARLSEGLEDGMVQCHLSPRNCKMKPGQPGFCGVRQNVGGKLVTLNYGRATHVTQESIETEAVFHYGPGAPILSLGNVGCMMNCDYCHNWKTSQARFVSSKDVHHYTPERVVEMALDHHIPVISWTYNDPVVWHEFVLDTSRLAHEHGMRNLFKSAFFISLEGATELCEVIDIFSVSIKSMDEAFYRKITKGWLQPVLDATKFVFQQGKHVEVSMLMVTDANDTPDDARRLAEWVLTNLAETVPVHFVRFHPDYKYTHVSRTPVDRLEAARQAAMEMGLRYCYVGNVYDTESVHTYCTDCGHKLIERYGLNARVIGLDEQGCCQHCQRRLDYMSLDYQATTPGEHLEALQRGLASSRSQKREFMWHGDIKSLHVEAYNTSDVPLHLSYRRLNGLPQPETTKDTLVAAHDSFRFIISKSTPNEHGVELFAPAEFTLRLFEVYDRAHYPTVDLDSAQADQDQVPLPRYEKRRGVNIA